MAKSVTSYSLLISCPSDVVNFLDNIKDAIDSFNHGFGRNNNIIVNYLHWSKDVYSNISKNGSPQGEVSNQIFGDEDDEYEVDMLVGIFWTRFGTPTQKYGSGTEEEINIMLDSGKPVILYFLDKPIPPSEIDTEQIKRIQEFKKLHDKDGIYRVLKDEAELGLRLRDDLELRFAAQLKKQNKAYASVSNTKTILWVDDRPQNNTEIREFFEGNGIEVIPALSTKQALNYLENNEVSVIISDMGRKEGPREGYVLLDTLRKNGNSTPFIIYAGSNSPEHLKETLKHGGQGNTNNAVELVDMVSAILLGTFYKQN